MDVDTDHSSDDADSEDSGPGTWISYFCGLHGHEFFCEVDASYIRDKENMVGLSTKVPMYQEAIDHILDVLPEQGTTTEEYEDLQNSANILYGLIHRRFIRTQRGLKFMLAKWRSGVFGYCPRVYCNEQRLLPHGLSDLRDVYTVKVYCANCEEAYHPRSARHNEVDGAYFGTAFVHVMWIIHQETRPGADEQIMFIPSYKVRSNRKLPFKQLKPNGRKSYIQNMKRILKADLRTRLRRVRRIYKPRTKETAGGGRFNQVSTNAAHKRRATNLLPSDASKPKFSKTEDNNLPTPMKTD